MTAQTVTGAVAIREKQDKVVAWIRAQQDDIAMIAASHVKPSAIVRVTQGALRRNEKLMEAAVANPQSLLYALLDAARLGHEPDTDDYYLVPFGNEVTGIEGYKGIIERMYRAGGVSSVVAEVVRKNDVYRRTSATTPPVHEYDEFADPGERGALRGAYAYAVMPGGGFSKIITMGRAEIMEHKAKSRGSDRADSPWKVWEPAMWKKTVLRALEPYVPTSTEYRTAGHLLTGQGAAELSQRMGTPGALKSGDPVPPAVVEPDIVDAELVDEPATQPPAETPSNEVPKREDPTPQPASKAACDKLGKLVSSLELGDPADVAALYEWLVAAPWAATRQQVTTVTSYLDDHLRTAQGDTAVATSAIWAQYNQASPQAAGDGA